MRRSIVSMMMLIVLVVLSAIVAFAQEDTPNVVVSVNDAGVEFSSEISAGFVNLTFENNQTEESWSPLIARLSDGVTMEDFLAAEESEDPFASLGMGTFYGGGEVAAGESLSYITELISGDYLLFNACEFCDDEELISFTVVEGDNMEQTAPESDVTLALVDFAFGVPAQIPAGPQVWHIENFGNQWHHAIIFAVDEGTTTLEARNTLMSEMSEGPPPYMPVWGWLPSSPDTQSWVTIDLEPGTYVISCFLPDLNGDFSPHLAHGMIQVFVVE